MRVLGGTRTSIGSRLTPAGSVKHSPHKQVIAKVFESMLGCGRHEKQVP
jgi:hypothetical protein